MSTQSEKKFSWLTRKLNLAKIWQVLWKNIFYVILLQVVFFLSIALQDYIFPSEALNKLCTESMFTSGKRAGDAISWLLLLTIFLVYLLEPRRFTFWKRDAISWCHSHKKPSQKLQVLSSVVCRIYLLTTRFFSIGNFFPW